MSVIEILNWVERRVQDYQNWQYITGTEVDKAKKLVSKVKIFLGRIPILWDSMFFGKPVVVLGPKGTGKSALISYLLYQKPDDPEPTSGQEEVDRRAELDQGQVLHFARDVGGDVWSKTFWQDLVKEINPEAIIFMLDGRKQIEQLLKDFSQSIEEVLPLYKQNRQSLRFIYILCNFYDIWQKDVKAPTSIQAQVLDAASKIQLAFPSMREIKFAVYNTQLNPKLTDWKETRSAMYHLAADLKSDHLVASVG